MNSALDGLEIPTGLPRNIVALVGENENNILKTWSQELMAGAERHDFRGHVIDLKVEGWDRTLSDLISQGVLLAFGYAGVGSRLSVSNGPFWDEVKTPFISVLADSPCQMPIHHKVASSHVANGYLYGNWLEFWRRFIHSPQLATLLPLPSLPNRHRDEIPWSKRQHRMVFVKTARSPELHREEIARLPRRLRAVVEDSAAVVLATGVGDITDHFLASCDHHGLALDGRLEVLCSLLFMVDQYVRDSRSTSLARALLDLPVDIIGRGWDHLAGGSHRARFHSALDGATLPLLFANTQYLLNTLPNFAHRTHERVLYAFEARACVVTNENTDMQTRFGSLPTYFPIDTESPALADRMAEIFHLEREFDDESEPALDLVEQDFSGDAFMRALIEFSLEVRATAGVSPIQG